ncbi:hypothetical protein ACVIW0_002008 [Bradyrhizobium sp. USDA 4454]
MSNSLLLAFVVFAVFGAPPCSSGSMPAAIAAFPWNIAIQVGLSLMLGTVSCIVWALFGTALRPVLTRPGRSVPPTSSWPSCCRPRSTRSSWTHDAAPRHAR